MSPLAASPLALAAGLGWLLPLLALGVLLAAPTAQAREISLPRPDLQGQVPLEQVLNSRRTQRQFAAQGLSLAQLGQLAWAAYGVTATRQGLGLKTVPSAGARYPLEIYLVVGGQAVPGVEAGCYRYLPDSHALTPVKPGDQRQALAEASWRQMWMAQAPVSLVIAAQYRRCTERYGNRGVMYTHMEAGHAAQNIFLQAEALGLGAGIVGAFDNPLLSQALGLPEDHEPLLAMPVGYAR